jgi:hypothetical protein
MKGNPMLNKLLHLLIAPSVTSVLATYQKTISDLRDVADYHVNKQLAIETKQDKLLAKVEALQVKADNSFNEAHLAHETIAKFDKFLNS